MYKIKPYFTDFVVAPAKIIYMLPSYHQHDDEGSNKGDDNISMVNGLNCAKSETTKPNVCNNSSTQQKQSDENVKENANQEKAIKRLFIISKRLDKFIAKSKESEKDNTKTIENSTPQQNLLDGTINNNNVELQIKKDKVSKKEERKEKRQAAKNLAETSKLVSNKSTVNEKKSLDTHTILEVKSTNPKFYLKKLPANSPDLMHANIQPTAPTFPIHDYGAKSMREHYLNREMSVTVRGKDKFWVQLFDDIGRNREIRFVNFVTDNEEGKLFVPTSHLKIKTVYDDESEIRLNIGNVEILGEIAIWKFFGTLLGIYSSEDILVSSKTDKWLLDIAIAGDNFDSLSRELNAFLGVHDFLSSNHAICLADLIVRSLFTNQQTAAYLDWKEVNAANNVQLWLKRVDKSLSQFTHNI